MYPFPKVRVRVLNFTDGCFTSTDFFEKLFLLISLYVNMFEKYHSENNFRAFNTDYERKNVCSTRNIARIYSSLGIAFK